MALRRNVALQLSHSYKQITVLLITYAELTNRRLGRVKPAPRVTNFDIRVSQSLVNRVVTPKCCRQLIGLYLPESLFRLVGLYCFHKSKTSASALLEV